MYFYIKLNFAQRYHWLLVLILKLIEVHINSIFADLAKTHNRNANVSEIHVKAFQVYQPIWAITMHNWLKNWKVDILTADNCLYISYRIKLNEKPIFSSEKKILVIDNSVMYLAPEMQKILNFQKIPSLKSK